MARSDCSSTWYWRRICSYCSKVIISRPPIVKGFAVPFTIADLRTPGKLFEYISLSQWPTFSLQNTVLANFREKEHFFGYNVYSPDVHGDRIYQGQSYRKNYREDEQLPHDVLETYEVLSRSDIVWRIDP